MQPNYIPAYLLTSTRALDKALRVESKVLVQHDRAMAQVALTIATANAKIDRAFSKANRAINAAGVAVA